MKILECGRIVLQLSANREELARLPVAIAEMAIVKQQHMQPCRRETWDIVLKLLADARGAMRHHQRGTSPFVAQQFRVRRRQPSAARNAVAWKFDVLRRSFWAVSICQRRERCHGTIPF